MLCVVQQLSSEIIFHPSLLEKNRVMSMIVKLVGGEKNHSLDHKHILAAKSRQIHAVWKIIILRNDFSGWK